jgi:hypothetical protein
VAARERTGEGDVDERQKPDRARQLLRQEWLGHQDLEDDLDPKSGEDQEWEPEVAATVAQPRDRKSERYSDGDFRLPEDPYGGGEEVEPRRLHRLDEIEQCAIELAQRAGRDERAQQDEGDRGKGDPDQR